MKVAILEYIALGVFWTIGEARTERDAKGGDAALASAIGFYATDFPSKGEEEARTLRNPNTIKLDVEILDPYPVGWTPEQCGTVVVETSDHDREPNLDGWF